MLKYWYSKYKLNQQTMILSFTVKYYRAEEKIYKGNGENNFLY